MIISGEIVIIKNMSTLTITWDQLMDMSSPAAAIGTTDALFEEIENILNDGGEVHLKNSFGDVSKRLLNMNDYREWKDSLIPVVEAEEIEAEEIELEAGEPIELDFEDVETKDLDDDEFEEVKDKK